MAGGSVVSAMPLYSMDRPQLWLACLSDTESLKLAGKEKKDKGYWLTTEKVSRYALKMVAVVFRVCVCWGNRVILILIPF